MPDPCSPKKLTLRFTFRIPRHELCDWETNQLQMFFGTTSKAIFCPNPTDATCLHNPMKIDVHAGWPVCHSYSTYGAAERASWAFVEFRAVGSCNAYMWWWCGACSDVNTFQLNFGNIVVAAILQRKGLSILVSHFVQHVAQEDATNATCCFQPMDTIHLLYQIFDRLVRNKVMISMINWMATNCRGNMASDEASG